VTVPDMVNDVFVHDTATPALLDAAVFGRLLINGTLFQ
jgi:hypothetical protein